jgi:transcriptional regulator with XRE-family HTH domain
MTPKQRIQNHDSQEYMAKKKAEIDLSVKIKKHRERLGLSQRELAEKMGVLQPTITRMESGESGIHSTTLKKFCDVVGLEIDFVPREKTKEDLLFEKGFVFNPYTPKQGMYVNYKLSKIMPVSLLCVLSLRQLQKWIDGELELGAIN